MAKNAGKMPRPGRAVRGSRSGRPIMAAINLMGQRWILRIVWELRDRPLNFRALQKACDGLSPSVLNQRLTDLRQAQIVELDPSQGYRLTKLGGELLEKLQPLQRWAEKWSKAVDA